MLILLLLFSLALIFIKLGDADLGHFREEKNFGTLPYHNDWMPIKNNIFKSPMHYKYNNYHEYRYSTVVQEILESNNWLILKVKNHGQKMDYYHKGPIYFWLSAAFSKIFGFSKFSVRFWPAFSAFGIIIVTYFISKDIFNKTIGLLSALILTTTFQFLHIDGARAVSMDTIFAFFVILSIYFLLKQEKWYKLFYLSAVFISLAGLTRSILMILPLAIFFFSLDFFMMFDKKAPKVFIKKWLIGLAIIVTIFSPWVIIQYHAGGQLYINDVNKFQIKEEFINKIYLAIPDLYPKFQYNLFLDERPSDAMFYPWTIFKGFFPWSMLVILAIIYSLKLWWQENNKKLFAILFSIGVILLFVYIKEQKWVRYMINIYPFLSIIVAKLLIDFYNHKNNILLTWGMLTVFAIFYSVIIPFNFNAMWIGFIYGAAFFVLLILFYFKDYKIELHKSFALFVIIHFCLVAILNILQPYFV